jgi:hypothetical protein
MEEVEETTGALIDKPSMRWQSVYTRTMLRRNDGVCFPGYDM